jgi:hypothetical protein
MAMDHKARARDTPPRGVCAPRSTTFNETTRSQVALCSRGDYSDMEIAMKRHASLALAAAVLPAGISAASAASTQNQTMAPLASDTLNLTPAQQKMVWDDLYTGA